MRANYTIVQAIRGIAALWVVLFHASEGGHVPSLYAALPARAAQFLFDAGHLGVAIFFTLSGFVIAHSLSGVDMTARGWGSFMLRRSIRLDPAYWASIVVVLAFGAISARVVSQPFELPSVANVVAHIAYMQVILNEPAISSVYWTLTYEVQFYAFFAVAIIWRRHMWVLLPLALLSAAGAFGGIVPGLFVNLWASFYIGVLARYAVDDYRWLCAIVLIGAPLAWSGTFGLTNVATAVFLFASVRSGWAETGLNWRWLQFAGAISYSLYLLHNPISGAAGYLTHKFLGHGMLSDVTALIAIIVFSVVAAFCLCVAVERPTQRLSKGLAIGRRGQRSTLVEQA